MIYTFQSVYRRSQPYGSLSRSQAHTGSFYYHTQDRNSRHYSLFLLSWSHKHSSSLDDLPDQDE